MPTYEYRCTEKPEHTYTEIRGMTESSKLSVCQEDGCEGKLMRVFSAPPVNFKGTGFSSKYG